MTTIRLATPADAPRLRNIYAHYVQTSTATFDLTAPSVAQFAQAQAEIQARFPYLVATTAAGVVGYAYAHAFANRAAYDWSVETSIYLAPAATGAGLGRQLYALLMQELMRQHVVTVTACITAENLASIRFHQRLGFTQVAAFPTIANKFGRWLGIVWLEKQLMPVPTPPAPVVAYPQLVPLAPQILAD